VVHFTDIEDHGAGDEGAAPEVVASGSYCEGEVIDHAELNDGGDFGDVGHADQS